ncbi:SMI1/KNR4 family protein [Deinococcus multiflagellatus]|uniref:SMI1/KNR4 family protein n=1 Tax=Deinococcus multiflagellatus TaxID=1656887 RepID=A0ABW1ZQS1_9DEIO|nr:SMI1/KNR4 family protein [Deinococcus multiflagellatus]MBZ9715945.1 SMI1/KNR4 family protein [Deinococcus multiflagellatus]
MSPSAFAAALQARVPALAAPLRPPASPADFQAAEAALGRPLPAPVRDAYSTHDGQDGVVPGVMFGMTWLPLRRAVQEHATWMDLAQDDTSLTSEPEGAIKAVSFSRGWLPFATDGAGNGLAVDLDPGAAGTTGQVITYGPDETTHRVVSPDLGAFLGWAARAAQAGDLSLHGDDAQFQGASSFLDALRQLPLPLA